MLFNPRRMHKGYDSRSVCVCVCVSMSDTGLPATYKSQVHYCMVPCGVLKVCIEPILLKTLCSPVLRHSLSTVAFYAP